MSNDDFLFLCKLQPAQRHLTYRTDLVAKHIVHHFVSGHKRERERLLYLILILFLGGDSTL